MKLQVKIMTVNTFMYIMVRS